jgi:predicted Zn-dependent protease
MELLRKQRRYAEAQTDGLRLLELEPDDDLALDVGKLSFSAGDFVKAEELFRQVLKGRPDRPDVVRLLTQALQARGKNREAADLLDGLLRKRPDDMTVAFGRGVLAVEMDEPDVAIPLLERVRDRDPTRQRPVRAQLVRAYTQAGRTEDARRAQREMHALQEAEVLRDALESQPDDPDVQARAGRAWLEAGQTEKGLKLLERTLEKHPNHAGAHLALAEHYERQGDKALAARHRRLAGKPSPP